MNRYTLRGYKGSFIDMNKTHMIFKKLAKKYLQGIWLM